MGVQRYKVCGWCASDCAICCEFKRCIDEGNPFYPNQLVDFLKMFMACDKQTRLHSVIMSESSIMHHGRCVIKSIDRVHRRFEGLKNFLDEKQEHQMRSNLTSICPTWSSCDDERSMKMGSLVLKT